MKIAVIGKGNTGQAVIDLLGEENISEVFDSKNIVTVEKLNQADAVIVFVSSEVLIEILEVLLQTNTPIISGTTGFEYTRDLIENINKKGHVWIVAHNFSLSMVFIKDALAALGKLKSLIPQVKYSINEIHHIKKIDSPSGTALSWRDWISVEECEISSERVGDIKGIHEVEVDYEYETIEFKHTTHNRKLFAQGAILAAKYAINNQNLLGFYYFEVIIKELINA